MTPEQALQGRLASASEILGVVAELCGSDQQALRLAQSIRDKVASESEFTKATEKFTQYLECCGELGKLVMGRCASLHPAREPHLWPAVLEPLA